MRSRSQPEVIYNTCNNNYYTHSAARTFRLYNINIMNCSSHVYAHFGRGAQVTGTHCHIILERCLRLARASCQTWPIVIFWSRRIVRRAQNDWVLLRSRYPFGAACSAIHRDLLGIARIVIFRIKRFLFFFFYSFFYNDIVITIGIPAIVNRYEIMWRSLFSKYNDYVFTNNDSNNSRGFRVSRIVVKFVIFRIKRFFFFIFLQKTIVITYY